MKQSALIVDDDRTERRLLSHMLQQKLHMTSIEAEDGRKALDVLSNDKDVCVIILDLDMPVMGGIDTLQHIHQNHPDIPVIILTGSNRIDDAINAMRMKVCDFLTKPAQADTMNTAIHNALKGSFLSKRQKRRSEQKTAISFKNLVGHDSGLAESVLAGRKAAHCDFPVLIEGKTGTGKEAFASAIHAESARAQAPFIALNCGAIPEKLVESILFGHEKGAFTGAVAKSTGKFQEADGGTIFLDEIGELPLDAQVKLLRVLQQKEVEPVGATKPVSVDIRIISATNRKLLEEVKNGRFREDLYYRLNVLEIHLPTLSDRLQDIPELSNHFIQKFCADYNVSSKSLDGSSIAHLQSHHWAGNVRELENVINRAMVLCEDTIITPAFLFLQGEQEGDMPPALQQNVIRTLRPDGNIKPFDILEREIIVSALSHYNNNISLTARQLGIAKSTLYAKLNGMTDLRARRS